MLDVYATVHFPTVNTYPYVGIARAGYALAAGIVRPNVGPPSEKMSPPRRVAGENGLFASANAIRVK